MITTVGEPAAPAVAPRFRKAPGRIHCTHKKKTHQSRGQAPAARQSSLKYWELNTVQLATLRPPYGIRRIRNRYLLSTFGLPKEYHTKQNLSSPSPRTQRRLASIHPLAALQGTQPALFPERLPFPKARVHTHRPH
jgi:hypothetical protein